MRVLQYGFFGEDIAQREFLAAYLRYWETQDIELLFELCADACREAFVLGHPKLDWLFIGRDVDSFDFTYHERRTQELRAKIPAQWQSRTLLMLPMQCAEHWLLYLAQCPTREPLERKPNDQAKDLVYADHSETKETIRTKLLATLDAERIVWLAEMSASFRAFHQQVSAYAALLPAEGQ
jgi:hypothetical protein